MWEDIKYWNFFATSMKNCMNRNEQSQISTVAWLSFLFSSKEDSYAFLICKNRHLTQRKSDNAELSNLIMQNLNHLTNKNTKCLILKWNKFFSEPKYMWKDKTLNYDGRIVKYLAQTSLVPKCSFLSFLREALKWNLKDK